MKIYMVSLFHKATINKQDKNIMPASATQGGYKKNNLFFSEKNNRKATNNKHCGRLPETSRDHRWQVL